MHSLAHVGLTILLSQMLHFKLSNHLKIMSCAIHGAGLDYKSVNLVSHIGIPRVGLQKRQFSITYWYTNEYFISFRIWTGVVVVPIIKINWIHILLFSNSAIMYTCSSIIDQDDSNIECIVTSNTTHSTIHTVFELWLFPWHHMIIV